MNNKADKIIMLILTILYALISFINFGKLHLNNTSWVGLNKTDQLLITFDRPTLVNKINIDYGLTTGKYHIIYNTSDGQTGTLIDPGINNFPPHYQWSNLHLDESKLVQNMIFQIDEPQVEIRQLAFFDNQGNYLNNFVVEVSPSMTGMNSLVSDTPPTNIYNKWLSSTIFDEIYYVSSAKQYINGQPPYVDVHPPLGMLLIAIALLLFGISPFAWRLIPNLFGIILVPVMYIFAHKIFRDRRLAIIAAILIMTEFMHFTISRLAFLDSILTLFITLEYYYLYCYVSLRLNGSNFKPAVKYLYLSAIFLGCGIATKLNATFSAPAIFIWLVYCEVIHAKFTTHELIRKILYIGAIFTIIPLTIYIISYIPYSKSMHAQNIFAFVFDRYQHMYQYQVEGLKNATHPYASKWWTWPLLKTPMSISYWQEGTMSASIALIGNPAIYWGSIPAVGILIYKWFKQPNHRIAFILIALFAQYLPYALVERISFIYYFYPVTPFLILAIVYVLKLAFEQSNKIYHYLAYTYVALNIGLFMLYFPTLAGLEVPRNYTVHVLYLMRNWNF
jgi:dolichyl-phosphate-mannose--protein O-mannosyl transferase